MAPLTKISSGLLCISNRLPNACDVCLGNITKFDISGETIRFGLDTAVFKQNVQKINNSPKEIRLNFNITFGTTNYETVVDTVRELFSLMPQDREFHVTFNPIFGPDYFAVHFLSAWQIERAVNLITKQIDELEAELNQTYKLEPPYNAYNAIKNLKNDFLEVVRKAVDHRLTYNRKETILRALDRLDHQEEIRKTNWRRDLPSMYRDWQEILQDESNTNEQ